MQNSSYEQTSSSTSSRGHDFPFPSPSASLTSLTAPIGSFNLTSFTRSPHVYLYEDESKLICS